jgi:hypothetical protein
MGWFVVNKIKLGRPKLIKIQGQQCLDGKKKSIKDS